MAALFVLLALLPVGAGALIAGDFSQYLYKPTYKQVYFILRNRIYLIGGSALLWLAGLAWHLFVAPTSPWLLLITAILGLFFTVMGFFMSGYILFRGLHHPAWISAHEADAHLAPEEQVIGLEINGDARAYPVKWILRPHLVTETVGQEPVIMSYCMLCNSAMAFKPELASQELHFIAPLQWENNLMLYDAASESLVQQLTGRVVDGPNAGHSLPTYPTRIMPWAAWKQLHPHTQVLHHPPAGPFDKLARKMLVTQIFEPNWRQEKPIFPTISRFDERLPNKAPVLGLCVGEVCKAYPLTLLQEKLTVNDDVNGVPLLIAYDARRDIADVFHREHAGQTLTFRCEIDADGVYRLIDQETGSQWELTGRAIAGPLQGDQLGSHAHFSRAMWFSWANFHPDTALAT